MVHGDGGQRESADLIFRRNVKQVSSVWLDEARVFYRRPNCNRQIRAGGRSRGRDRSRNCQCRRLSNLPRSRSPDGKTGRFDPCKSSASSNRHNPSSRRDECRKISPCCVACHWSNSFARQTRDRCWRQRALHQSARAWIGGCAWVWSKAAGTIECHEFGWIALPTHRARCRIGAKNRHEKSPPRNPSTGD